jgi:hypothetical protein
MLYFLIVLVLVGLGIMFTGMFRYSRTLAKMQNEYVKRLENHYNEQRELFGKFLAHEVAKVRE